MFQLVVMSIVSFMKYTIHLKVFERADKYKEEEYLVVQLFAISNQENQTIIQWQQLDIYVVDKEKLNVVTTLAFIIICLLYSMPFVFNAKAHALRWGLKQTLRLCIQASQ